MKLFLPTILVSVLSAKEIDTDNLGGIYTEAILFLAVFGTMSIVSIIISRKNAKKFESENPLEGRKTARREEALKKELEDIPVSAQTTDIDRLIELSNMLKNGLISKKEFDTLKANLNITET